MASPSLPGGQLGAWQTEDAPLWAGTDLPEQGQSRDGIPACRRPQPVCRPGPGFAAPESGHTGRDPTWASGPVCAAWGPSLNS